MVLGATRMVRSLCPVRQDIGPAALPLGDHVGQVHPGETFCQEFSVSIITHPAHQARRQAQAGQGISGVGRHAAAPAPRRPAVSGQQGRQARLTLPGDGLFTAPAETGAPLLRKPSRSSTSNFRSTLMAPRHMIGDGMPGKLPGFTAPVKARASWSPGIPLRSRQFTRGSFKITPCNPWIFSEDVLS